MAKKTAFLFHPIVNHPTQKWLNNYFYKQVERINQYAVQWNESYEWKEILIDKLIKDHCGYPKKLTLIQKIFN